MKILILECYYIHFLINLKDWEQYFGFRKEEKYLRMSAEIWLKVTCSPIHICFSYTLEV